MMFPTLRGGNTDIRGRKEFFYGEVDDVHAAANHLARLPYVDPARSSTWAATARAARSRCSSRRRAEDSRRCSRSAPSSESIDIRRTLVPDVLISSRCARAPPAVAGALDERDFDAYLPDRGRCVATAMPASSRMLCGGAQSGRALHFRGRLRSLQRVVARYRARSRRAWSPACRKRRARHEHPAVRARRENGRDYVRRRDAHDAPLARRTATYIPGAGPAPRNAGP